MAQENRLSKLVWGAIAGGAITGVTVAVGYIVAVRPWILSWGANADEMQRALPGDELIPNPRMQATHAVTIHAPAARVWPWLAQIGYQRAGWYSYDWLHRLMGVAGSVGNERGSAERIIPTLQDLKVGDVVEIGPDMGYNVVDVQPGRALVLHVALETGSFRSFDPAVESPANSLESSWTWFLDQTAPATTRLIVRTRVTYTSGLANVLMTHGVMEPGSFVMERRTLLGIKERAEAQGS